MINEFDYHNAIEDFLKGNISPSDKIELEQRLASDPSFKSEFELQKDVFSVIRNARKSELKASLASIHIPWYYLVPTGLKIAVIVGVVSVAGLSSTYLYNAYFHKPASHEILNIQSDRELQKSSNNIVPPEPEVKKPEVNKSPSEEGIKEIKKNDKKPDLSVNGNGKDEKVITPATEIVVPNPGLDNNAGDIDNNELSEDRNDGMNKTSSINKLDDKVVNVKTIKSKDYQFNYTFREGALILYGNFSGNPYKILEINSSKGREYYLFYSDHYYFLQQNTSELKPLIKVTDASLINELNILKDNK